MVRLWRGGTERHGKAARAAALALLGLILLPATGPAQTQDTSRPGAIAENPAETMASIARLLRRDANHVTMRVDSQTITQGDVADYIAAMPPRMASLGYEGVFAMAVEALGRQKLMLADALKQGLDQDPEVRRKSAIMSEKIVVDAWLARKTADAVSEQALRARYEQEFAGRPGPDQVRARIIVVPTEAEARTIIASLKAGADFGALARTKSKDPTAERAGDLGFVTRDALPPEIGAVMFALDVGEINGFPVAAGIGYCVLRVEGRRQGPAPAFESVLPYLEQSSRAAKVRDIVTNITKDTKVVFPVTPPNLTGTSNR